MRRVERLQKQIRIRVHAQNLFERRVKRRIAGDALVGQRKRRFVGVSLRRAEVEQINFSVFIYFYIVRFDVAVKN